MNRDNLDDILRRKLTDVRQEPPGDMWARLEASLGHIPDKAVSEPMIEERPKLVLRRPRRLRMGYAAAACVMLACIMIGFHIGVNNINQEIIADNPELLPQDLIEDIPDTDIPDILIAESPESFETVESSGLIRRLRENLTPVITAESTPVETVTDEKIARTETEDDISEPREIAGTDIKRGDADKARYEENITSDRKTDGIPVDWARVIAENDNRTRRASPLNFSLYTGDLVRTRSDRGINEDPMFVKDNSVPTLESVADSPERYKHKLPLSFGLNVNIGLLNRFSIETGIIYTYMYSEIVNEATYSEAFTPILKQKLHYVGIPLYIKYDFWQTPRITMYASAGGALEKCVSGKTYKSVASGDHMGTPETERLGVEGVQASLGLNVGLELTLWRSLGLYIEPGMGYYIKNDTQPISYRTANRFNFNLRTGFRVHFR